VSADTGRRPLIVFSPELANSRIGFWEVEGLDAIIQQIIFKVVSDETWWTAESIVGDNENNAYETIGRLNLSTLSRSNNDAGSKRMQRETNSQARQTENSR
jgi:hypothetical protein